MDAFMIFDRADAIRKKTQTMSNKEFEEFLDAIIRMVTTEVNFVEAAEKYFEDKK
jgi:hypothetical protein